MAKGLYRVFVPAESFDWISDCYLSHDVCLNLQENSILHTFLLYPLVHCLTHMHLKVLHFKVLHQEVRHHPYISCTVEPLCYRHSGASPVVLLAIAMGKKS